MNREIYETYVEILKKELIPAFGCTEPIAIAYAAAVAAEKLGQKPDSMVVCCSGNIVKNVKGVTVPNSGGMKGIEAAAILGMLAGRPEKRLEVLAGVGEADIRECRRLMAEKFCAVKLAKERSGLYIEVTVYSDGGSASVEIAGSHTNIVKIEKNGSVIFQAAEGTETCAGAEGEPDYGLLSVRDILQFADELQVEDVKTVLERQMEYNQAIAKEGMRSHYGVETGKLVMEQGEEDVRKRAIAYAAAGSDARMSGCPLPVVINSGSGNQGMTVSLPVMEYARAAKAEGEQLYRALAAANLIAVHQKYFIGSLSAYCGAVCAAAGAVSGIAYLEREDQETIEKAITNTICTIGGMVCDGAKPSCSAKIAAALNTAFLALDMARKGMAFETGDGLAKNGAEETIQSIGRMARNGLRETDQEILHIMMSE